MAAFLNSPAIFALVLFVPGFFAVKAIRGDVARIHALVDQRFVDALFKIEKLQSEVEKLQAEIEKLGGAKAPPTREESRDAADRQRH